MSEPQILIATKNSHKAGELAALTAGLAGTLSLAAWEREKGQALAEPAENGRSFLENARIKARSYAAATGLTTVADDSGLTVPALGGAPGIHSARFGGPGLTDRQRCLLLLWKMKNRRDRRAFFTTVLVLARPDGAALYWRGRLDGFITANPRGGHGFGYDPIFRPAGLSLTLSQLAPSQKNSLSHRALAAQAFQADLEAVRNFMGLRG